MRWLAAVVNGSIMRMRAGLVISLVVAIAGTAAAQPQGSSPERLQLEEHRTPPIPGVVPAGFTVMAFENRSGVTGLDWMSAGVPFVLAEKAARHLSLRPTYGALIVPPGPVTSATVESVSHLAGSQDAHWVWTGWFARPDWELELGVSLWRVDAAGVAAPIGEVIARGQFAEVHTFTGQAIAELARKAGLALNATLEPALAEPPTEDFYAFTLLGRGLAAFAGVGGEVNMVAATRDLSRAIFIDPTLAEGQRLVGELLLELDKPAQARLRFGTALELRPDYYPALQAHALLLEQIEKNAHACELYERMLALRPWDLEARYRLGRTLWTSGAADAAFAELQRVVAAAPEHVPARRVLVNIHASRGHTADLAKELEAVATLDPTDLQVRMDLGAAYTAMGAVEEAIGAYERVARDEPQNLQALKFLGDLHRRRGDRDASVSYYRRALDLDPEDPRAYFLLGAAHVQAGNDREAKRVYRRAQRFRKYLGHVYNNLGAIAYREGRYNESIWYMSRAVIKRPASARVRYNYALSLSAARDPLVALHQVDAGLRLDPQHVELNYLKGVVLLRQGEVEAARRAFERTLELDPEHDASQHNLALLREMERSLQHGEVVIEGP